MQLSLRARTAAVELIGQGDTWDAIKLSRTIATMGTTRWDESMSFDWYEYSYFLEDLLSKKIVRYAGLGADGHQLYTLAK